ncbi:hypothetical protein [Mucilaginibacter paludis]|uniref:Lipoprotein n=1 Tax=Mucilaginibacter paludis DSM 18603 TaxID=714943 RepID=H1YFN9_9SPHI|nr:hypothetical protein [Mucilaginibacter paludis]EHQ24441.1 hypothetical protein Mucpa_0242 [Mucilaginibacter paludis DSM 18603]
MNKILPFLFLALSGIISSCQQKRTAFDIHPLSPYTDVVKIKKDDIGSNGPTLIKTQYYIVNESADYTEKTKNRLQNFIEINLSRDVAHNQTIYFTFYTGGLTFTKNTTQTKNDLITGHAKDKLAEFEYVNGKLYNFDFYKDGTYYSPTAETR